MISLSLRPSPAWCFFNNLLTYKGQISICSSLIYLFVIISPLLVLLTMFLNTGCFIYPASFTCLSYFDWSINISEVNQMKLWYELWSKSGATPNYRVENPELYLTNLNWVSNWVSNYFFTKVTDLLAIIFVIII